MKSTTRKVLPKKPVQEWDEVVKQRYYFHTSMNMQQIVDAISDITELDKAVFNIETGYYDEVEYFIEYPMTIHHKMSDERYKKALDKYEKKLQEYNESQ